MSKFDAYGESVELEGVTAAGDRRARRAALAVFWTLALLLTAGRVWQRDAFFPDAQRGLAAVSPPSTTSSVAVTYLAAFETK